MGFNEIPEHVVRRAYTLPYALPVQGFPYIIDPQIDPVFTKNVPMNVHAIELYGKMKP